MLETRQWHRYESRRHQVTIKISSNNKGRLRTVLDPWIQNILHLRSSHPHTPTKHCERCHHFTNQQSRQVCLQPMECHPQLHQLALREKHHHSQAFSSEQVYCLGIQTTDWGRDNQHPTNSHAFPSVTFGNALWTQKLSQDADWELTTELHLQGEGQHNSDFKHHHAIQICQLTCWWP